MFKVFLISFLLILNLKKLNFSGSKNNISAINYILRKD